LSAGRLLGGFVIAFGRFYNQSHPNRLGRDLDPANIAVNDGPDLLYIRLELSFRDAGHFLADTAKIFRFTAPGYTPAGYRSFTRKITYSRHSKTPILFLLKLGSYPKRIIKYTISHKNCKAKPEFYRKKSLGSTIFLSLL
jgi:hypothetical protein